MAFISFFVHQAHRISVSTSLCERGQQNISYHDTGHLVVDAQQEHTFKDADTVEVEALNVDALRYPADAMLFEVSLAHRQILKLAW